jgi:uncharacterized protein YcfL
MRFSRFATFALALAVLAGCGSTAENQIEVPANEPAPADDSASMAELINRNLKTTSLDVGHLKDPAKTVGYAPGSTEVGEKLFDGALVVEHVARQDADNHFGATVSLLNNRDDAPAVFQWRIVFFNAQGGEMASLESGWKGKAIDAKRFGVVSDSATVRGAVTFKLEVRTPVVEAAPAPAPAP